MPTLAATAAANNDNNNSAHTINLPSKYIVPSHMSWTVTM